MGKHTNREQRDLDMTELGEVEDLADLEPEKDPPKSRKADTQARLADPAASGYFELEAGDAHGLGAPLHLSNDFKKLGGASIREYENGYNAYAAPLRSTFRALGRLKDISLTGAPLTPDELLKRRDMAAHIDKLTPKSITPTQELAMDVWSAQQAKMNNDIRVFGAGQHELAAVIANYRRVQARLEQHRTEAERTNKEHEAEQIRSCADTLAHVITLSAEAWNAAGQVDTMLAAHAPLDPMAGMESAEGMPAGTPNWQFGTPGDPSGATMSTRGTGQHAAKVLGEGGKTAGDIVAAANRALSTVGHYDMSLADVMLLVNDGGKAYRDLKKAIVNLEKQIELLKLHQESLDVKAANESLRGFRMEIAVRQQDVQADRLAARKGAKTFARQLDRSTDTIDLMYAAEAHQELAAFGALAAQQRQDMVDPYWRAADEFAHGHTQDWFSVRDVWVDGMSLRDNVDSVASQRDYFASHLSEWRANATQWNDFLAERSGSSLTPGPTQADVRSKAP